MHFIKSDDSSSGQRDLVESLNGALVRGKVLWLLSGGSNIQAEVNILNQLEEGLTSNLNMLLADERYGLAGHQDSNYTKLMSAGLNLKQSTFPDVLAGNLSPEETAKKYTETFNNLKGQSVTVVALLGIGEDGHIAGVLPNSPGVNSFDTVVSYQADDFERLSLSLNALKQIDKVSVFCFGDNKHTSLERLAKGQESLEELPSLILKQIPDVRVYNDLLEEN